jgi:hypothetical protein
MKTTFKGRAVKVCGRDRDGNVKVYVLTVRDERVCYRIPPPADLGAGWLGGVTGRPLYS